MSRSRLCTCGKPRGVCICEIIESHKEHCEIREAAVTGLKPDSSLVAMKITCGDHGRVGCAQCIKCTCDQPEPEMMEFTIP